MFSVSELILIRHAAADTKGRLCGRTDVGLAPGTDVPLAELSEILPALESVSVSPAKRCRLTAGALWPTARQVMDDRLWEQDFGSFDGRPYADLPDIGALSRSDLAHHTNPGGESFADLCARAEPALWDAADRARGAASVVLVVHAGIVRAGLGLALGDVTAGLAFQIDPLSVTRLTCLPERGFAIKAVNWRPS